MLERRGGRGEEFLLFHVSFLFFHGHGWSAQLSRRRCSFRGDQIPDLRGDRVRFGEGRQRQRGLAATPALTTPSAGVESLHAEKFFLSAHFGPPS